MAESSGVRRYAAHCLFLPGAGFVKNHVVEVSASGVVRGVTPLEGEAESVEWRPGVIALLSAEERERGDGIFRRPSSAADGRSVPVSPSTANGYAEASAFLSAFSSRVREGQELSPCLFYPFDFISMRPVDGTRRILLR